MKSLLLLTTLFTLVLFSGCATPDTAKLRMGMTKEQALQVMGKPETIGAEGRYEYLSYRIATGSYGYGQPYTVRLLDGIIDAYGSGSQIALRGFAPSSAQAFQSAISSAGGVRILTVEPSSATPDSPREFKFKVAYSLKDTPSGIIQLAFNVDQPKAYKTLATKAVDQISGETEIVVTLTPKDWGKLIDFAAIAMLRTGTVTAPGPQIATHSHEIPLTK